MGILSSVFVICAALSLTGFRDNSQGKMQGSGPSEENIGATPAAVAMLIKDLTARDQKAADVAAIALEKLGIRAIEQLLVAFEKGDDNTRYKVALVLGAIRRAAIANKEDEVAGPIEEILLSALRDSNYHVVSGAAYALTGKEPRSKKAIPAYIAILRSNEATHAARCIVRARLQEFGPDAAAAIPVLLDDLIKKRVEKMPRPHKGQDLSEAVNKSKDFVPGERCSIFAVLADIGPKDERVASVLREALKSRADDSKLGASAVLGLARMGSPGQAALPEIIDFLKETNKEKRKYSDERHAIMVALGHLKLAKNEIPLLIEAATDRDGDAASEAAVRALANNASVAGAAWLPLLKALDERGERGQGISRNFYYDIVVALGKIEAPANEPRETLAAQIQAIFARDRIEDEGPELVIAAQVLIGKLKGK